MDLQSALKKIKDSKEFMDWNKKNPDIFFSYAFKIVEEKKEQPWQLGFYHKSTDKVVTFVADNDEIEMQKEEEIFKKPDMQVKPLEIEKIKIPFKKILKITEEFCKKEYPTEIINKTIAILQNLEEYGNIWNITYITASFKTLNIKVNAENSKIMHHNIESLMSFANK